MRRISIIVAMDRVQGHSKQTALSPFHLIGVGGAADHGIASSRQSNQILLVEVVPRGQSSTRLDFVNHAIHVNISGKVQVDTAPLHLRPWKDLLGARVQYGIALHSGNLRILNPAAIKVTLDAATASNIRWTVRCFFLGQLVQVELLLLLARVFYRAWMGTRLRMARLRLCCAGGCAC